MLNGGTLDRWDVGCWTVGHQSLSVSMVHVVVHCTLNTLDVGRWTLTLSRWMLDSGRWKFGRSDVGR